MAKAKQRFRKAVQRARAKRFAQALTLAGLIISCVPAPVQALELELNLSPIWNVTNSILGLVLPANVTLTGHSSNSTVTTSGHYLGAGIGSLTVTGTAASDATLNLASNLLITNGLLSNGQVTLSGTTHKGIINIMQGNSLTAGGLISINSLGLLDVAGSLKAQEGVAVNTGGQLTLRTGSSLSFGSGFGLNLSGGTLLFSGADGITVGDGALSSSMNLKSGYVQADKLSFEGFGAAVNIAANGGALNVTANKLALDSKSLSIGSAISDAATTVTINGAKSGQSMAEFLGGNVNVLGSLATQTLQLGVAGNTGTSNSTASISINGGNGAQAMADKAHLKVDYGRFAVNSVEIGSTNALSAGTLTVNNSGRLDVTNTLNIYGGAGQAGVVKFGPQGGVANTIMVKNLTVGTGTAYGVLDLAGNAGRLIVDTANSGSVTVGSKGQVNVNNAASILEFTGNYTLDNNILSSNGSAANGKIWLNSGKLIVGGTLSTNAYLSTSLNGNNLVGVDTTAGAVDTTAGILNLNAGKTTTILGLNNGNLLSGIVQVLGKPSVTDTLIIGQDGASMNAGSQTQGEIKLFGGVGKAVLDVRGNGIANSIYQLKRLEAGGDNYSGGGSFQTGSITVNNATLKVATLTLLGGSATGAATMSVGGTAAADVVAGTFTVGNFYDKGHATLKNGSSLSTTTMNFHTDNGAIFVDNGSKLNLYDSATLSGSDLTKGTSLQQGNITFNTGASLNVANMLTLTGPGPMSIDMGSANLNTKTLSVMNGASPTGLTWGGGTLTLYGAGSSDVLQASNLTVSGGEVKLGGPDMYVGSTKLTTLGGNYAGSSTISGSGHLNVTSGNWSFSNTTTGMTISAANGLNVTDSFLGVGKLTTTVSGAVNVASGLGLSRLDITGGSNDLASVDGSIKVQSNGVFEARDVMVINGLGLKSGVGKFDIGLGGTLTLLGTGTLTQQEYNTLKANLINGQGSLNLLGYTITADPRNWLMDVKGTSRPELIAEAFHNDDVNSSTTVKGLSVDAKNRDIDVNVSAGELRLVGDSSASANFKFSDNGTFKTNFAVSNNALLTLGNAAGMGKTYGALLGDVTLANGGGLNAVQGEFGAGGVSGTGNVNVSLATLKLASLALSTAGTVTVNQTGVLQSDSDSTVFNLALDNGTFTTADGATPPATGKSLAVTGAISMINSSLLHVGKDLTLSGTVGTLSDSRIEVLGNLTATGKNIIGSNLNMAVGSTLSAANLTGDNASTFQLGALAATGATKVDHTSTLTVNGQMATVGLTVDNGSTVTAKASANTGLLSIGTTAASIMKVTANLDSSTVTLKNGSQLEVGGTLTASGATILDSASSLIVTGSLTTVGLTVDNGATVSANANAETGALAIGANAASVMTVAGKLTTSTVSVQNGATLSVVGDMKSTSTASVNNVGSAVSVGGNFDAAGLTVDNDALFTAHQDALINGALSIGPNAKAVMTVAQNLTVTGTVTLDKASTLDVTGNLTASGTTVNNGAVLTAKADADTGALSIGANAAAAMTVAGNLTAGAVNMNNGSTLVVTGDMTSSDVGGAGMLDKGAALTAKSLTLAGTTPASLTVGGADMASITVKELNVGNATQEGRLTVANGTVTTEVLNNTANGGVLLKATGIMNVLGNLSLAGLDLVSNTSLQKGKVALDSGSLNVAGNLELTGSGSVSTGLASTVNDLIRAKTVTAMDGVSPTSLTWGGGELVLYGDGAALSNATQLNVTGGKVRLGADDFAVASTTLTTLGGSYLAPISVSGTGTFEIYKGAWTLGNVNVTAANVANSGGGLFMDKGTLTAGTVTISGAGDALVSGGTMTATQITLSDTGSFGLTGGTVNTTGLTTTGTAIATIGGTTNMAIMNLTGGVGSLNSVAHSIGILNNGYFNAAFSSVASGTNPLGTVGKFDVATGGVLTLTGLSTITLLDYNALRGTLINGLGLLSLGSTSITGVDATTTLANVSGLSLPDAVVLAQTGNDVDQSTTVKGITIDPKGTADATLSISAGELRLVGDKVDHNFPLIDNGDKQTDITVGQNGSLALGDPTGAVPTYGILNGDIALDGHLKADNGTFTVGDVIGDTHATGVTVNNATLNTGALDLSQSPNSTVTVNNGTLSASKDSTVYDVNLDKGTLKTTGTADLTVNGTAMLVNDSTLAAGGDLTFTGTKPGDPILNGKDSTVTVGGNLDATGLNIKGDNLDIIVGGILEVADITGTNGSQYNAGSLAASGDVTLDKGATLTTVSDASVGGALTLGPTAASEMTVGGALDANSLVLNNGSKLSVAAAMAITGTTVLDNASSAKVGGTLTADNLVTVKGNSTLVADALDVTGAMGDVVVDSGAMLATTKNADIDGILSVGPTAKAGVDIGGNLTVKQAVLDHASTLAVKGGMTTSGVTTLHGGSTATVGGTFKAGDNVAVLDDSTLKVGTFVMTGHDIVVGEAAATGDNPATGGTFLANTLNTKDGGHLLLESESGKAFVGVDNLTDKQFTAMAVVSKNGILSLGTKDKQIVDARIAASIGASGISPSSVLLVSSPMALGTASSAGQILVGEKYHTNDGAEGMWGANTAVDPYALALRGNSLLVADMSKVPAGSSLITLGMASPFNSVLIEKSAAVHLVVDSGLKGGSTYTLVSGIGSLYQQEGGSALTEGQTLTLNSPLATNSLLISISDLTYRSGKLEAITTAHDAGSVLPDLSGGIGGILDGLALTGFDVNHASAGARFLSRATDTRYISGLEESTRTMESAARISAAGAVQGMTMGVADAVRSTLENRTNGLGRLHNKAMGISSGDDGAWVVEDGNLRPGMGLWFTPLYRSERVSGMKSGAFKTGYTGDLGGAAIGADYTTIAGEHIARVGASFNMGGGKAHSTGDFHRTNNDFDFWGLNFYGRWNYGAFGLRGDIGYISSDNSLKQNLPSSLGMEHLKSKVDSSVMMTGLTAEYRFNTSFANILPYAGVRYTGLTTAGHNTKSGGETVFHTAKEKQNIVSFPIGVAVEKTWEMDNGWTIKPSLDLGVIPAVGDIDANHKVSATGASGVASLNTRVVDRMTFAGGLGLQVKNDTVSFGLDYNMLASQHRTSHGASMTFRMSF